MLSKGSSVQGQKMLEPICLLPQFYCKRFAFFGIQFSKFERGRFRDMSATGSALQVGELVAGIDTTFNLTV